MTPILKHYITLDVRSLNCCVIANVALGQKSLDTPGLKETTGFISENLHSMWLTCCLNGAHFGCWSNPAMPREYPFQDQHRSGLTALVLWPDGFTH